MRYKTAAENSEKVEDELKAEKRKLQREVAAILDCSSTRCVSSFVPSKMSVNDLERTMSF